MLRQGKYQSLRLLILLMLSLVSINTQAEYIVLDGDKNKQHKVMVFGKGKAVEEDKLTVSTKRKPYCALIMEGKVPKRIAPTRTSGDRELIKNALPQIVAAKGWRYRIESGIENAQVTWNNAAKKPWTRVLDDVLCDNSLSGIVNWRNKVIEIVDAGK